ncbi:MAG: hypothetical protein Q8Q95_03970 [bacterium]|nr:hypothetical protein [bacterium]
MMTGTVLLNDYYELVCALSVDFQRQFLEALNTTKLQRVIKRSVNEEHLPITLTMQGLQFVVASMADLEHLRETIERELEATVELKV